MLKGFEHVGMTGGYGPRQNRVGPTGEIVADPARGMFMGNRGGVLHVDSRRLGVSRWKNRTWIACRLDFKDRRRSVMSPGRYTELFFLDEAVSFAAGHRPCAECRRGSYNAFAACWSVNGPRPGAGAMDSVLHAARVDGRTRTQVTSVAAIESLPDGAFIRLPGDPTPWLVRGDALRPFLRSPDMDRRVRVPGPARSRFWRLRQPWPCFGPVIRPSSTRPPRSEGSP